MVREHGNPEGCLVCCLIRKLDGLLREREVADDMTLLEWPSLPTPPLPPGAMARTASIMQFISEFEPQV